MFPSMGGLIVIVPDADITKVDAIVTSVKNQGIFADVGPLSVFVSKHVRRYCICGDGYLLTELITVDSS